MTAYPAMPAEPQFAEPQRIRPSLAWLILVAVLFLGGVGGCSALGYSGIHHVVDAVRLDQSGAMSLDSGKYTLYSTGPAVTITSPGGDSVPLKQYGSDTHLTLDSTRYHAISTFTAPTDGSYRLVLSGDGSVAVGTGLAANAKKIGIAIVLGFLGVMAAIAVLTIVLVRRSSHKRRLAYGGYREPGGYGYVEPNAAGGYPYQGYPQPNQGYSPPNQPYPPQQGYPPPTQPGPPPQ